MEFLGIGPSELVFIVILAIIILGPKDMQKAGRNVGRWLNQLIRSDGWKALQRASREIRNLPTNLMREANMEELQDLSKDLRQSIDPRRPSVSSPRRELPPSNEAETPSQPSTDNTEATESEQK